MRSGDSVEFRGSWSQKFACIWRFRSYDEGGSQFGFIGEVYLTGVKRKPSYREWRARLLSTNMELTDSSFGPRMLLRILTALRYEFVGDLVHAQRRGT
jgi:hypothetical protein